MAPPFATSEATGRGSNVLAASAALTRLQELHKHHQHHHERFFFHWGWGVHHHQTHHHHQAAAAAIWEAEEYLRAFIRARWPQHMPSIKITCDLTMAELRAVGHLERAAGTLACRRLVRVPVLDDEIGAALWQRLAREARGPGVLAAARAAEQERGRRQVAEFLSADRAIREGLPIRKENIRSSSRTTRRIRRRRTTATATATESGTGSGGAYNDANNNKNDNQNNNHKMKNERVNMERDEEEEEEGEEEEEEEEEGRASLARKWKRDILLGNQGDKLYCPCCERKWKGPKAPRPTDDRGGEKLAEAARDAPAATIMVVPEGRDDEAAAVPANGTRKGFPTSLSDIFKRTPAPPSAPSLSLSISPSSAATETAASAGRELNKKTSDKRRRSDAALPTSGRRRVRLPFRRSKSAPSMGGDVFEEHENRSWESEVEIQKSRSLPASIGRRLSDVSKQLSTCGAVIINAYRH